MPTWLPPVLPFAAVIAGQLLMIWLNVHLLTARLNDRDERWKERQEETDRRLTHVEVHKLATDIHVLSETRLLSEVSQVRHRVGAIEMREIARADKP